MGRKRYLHESLIHELRNLLCNMIDSSRISDDTDQWYVGAAGYSPMERLDEQNANAFQRAEAIGEELVRIGPPAADSVALGLRMQGRWREYLVPYARAYGDIKVIAKAVELVRKRQRDPLRSLV